MLMSKRAELRLECDLGSQYQNYIYDILEIFLLGTK